MTMHPRKPVFDAARAAKADVWADPGNIHAMNQLLDALGFDREDKAPRTINPAGRTIIKNVEGLRLKAYQDTGGVWTVAWGHTGPDVHVGLIVTEARAEELLSADLAEAEADVARLFPVTTDNQFSALGSLMFNEGAKQLAPSTLRAKHNAGDYAGAKAEFGRWVYDNGVKLGGLVKRRAIEAELYGKADA